MMASTGSSSSSNQLIPENNCYWIGSFPYTNTKCTIAASMCHVRLLKFQTCEPIRRLNCYINCVSIVNDPTNILTNVSGWARIRITVIKQSVNNVMKYVYRINLTMCNTNSIHRDTPTQEFQGLIMLPGNIERLSARLTTNTDLVVGLCSAPHYLIMKSNMLVNPLFAESDDESDDTDDDSDNTVFIN